MPYLAFDWGRLHYHDRGGREPALVFLHGTGVDGACWDRVWAELPADRRLLACDYRCHGRSATPAADWTFADLCADVTTWLQALGEPPCVLVGHSLGGMIAGAIGAELPQCRGLVLVEGWTHHAAWSAFAAGRYYAGLDPGLRERLDAQGDANRGRVSPERWGRFWATVTAADTRAALAACDRPVKHLYGAAGREPETLARLGLPANPLAELRWQAGIGHFAPWLASAAIAAACTDLLAYSAK